MMVHEVDNDYLRPKRALQSLRLSEETLKELDIVWKTRLRPDPYNPNKSIPFKSKQEYLEFVVRCSLKSGKTSWYFYSHILNPDYPVD